MQYMVIAVFAGAVFAVYLCLKEKNRQLSRLREQTQRDREEREKLENQVEVLQNQVRELEGICSEVRELAGITHLYASLSREETKQESLKEKQEEIILASEYMFEKIKKKM